MTPGDGLRRTAWTFPSMTPPRANFGSVASHALLLPGPTCLTLDIVPLSPAGGIACQAAPYLAILTVPHHTPSRRRPLVTPHFAGWLTGRERRGFACLAHSLLHGPPSLHSLPSTATYHCFMLCTFPWLGLVSVGAGGRGGGWVGAVTACMALREQTAFLLRGITGARLFPPGCGMPLPLIPLCHLSICAASLSACLLPGPVACLRYLYIHYISCFSILF